MSTTEKRPFACCPRCGEPLVSTFEFRGKEWICMACPALWEWLAARDGAATPEMQAKYEDHKTRYDADRAQRRSDGTYGQWPISSGGQVHSAATPPALRDTDV